MKYRCSGNRRKHRDGTPLCTYEASEPWLGRCPVELGGCGRYYSIVRDRPEDDRSRTSLANLAMAKPPDRISTGIKEFDYVLGGGLVVGSTIVLTGPPGMGKTTVLIQAANAIATPKKTVLYTSGEQNKQDIGIFASRLGTLNSQIDVLGNEGNAYHITSEAERRKPSLLIVDSVQTAFIEDVGGDVGSAQQIKAVTNWLTSFGKVENVIVILVSHVTKDLEVAGPKSFEHLVDGLAFLEPYELTEDSDLDGVDETYLVSLRQFAIGKNRFGPPGLISVVEMTEKGLQTPSRPISKKLIVPSAPGWRRDS